MKVAVRVRARLFARLREQAGTDFAEVELEPGATVADVYEALRRSHPALEPNRALIRPALDQESMHNPRGRIVRGRDLRSVDR